MDVDSKGEEINEEIVITDHSTIDVQAIEDHDNTQSSSVVLNDGDVNNQAVVDKPSLTVVQPMQQISHDNTVLPTMASYSAPIAVEGFQTETSSVCPVEPMDQSSHTLPRLVMAPVHDGSVSGLHSDGEINQAWFTTKEDKDCLQEKGVKWRQGMWSKEESKLLQNNIFQYCKSRGISDPHEVVFKQSKEERKSFYRTIAKGIHRPLFAIYRRVLRMYETGNYNGKYTPEEVTKLKELKRKHGNDWTAIGLALGRSASSVKDRCRLLNEKCSTANQRNIQILDVEHDRRSELCQTSQAKPRGKWTQDEEDRLSEAVRELTSTLPGESVTTGILWTEVAASVGTRSEKQCRSKWLNYLNWKESCGKEWNKTDEIDLIKKIYNLGVQNENEIDWTTLADGWSSARSPQWLRSKWWTIKKHVPQCLSFPDGVSFLHSEYARSLKHRLNRHDTARYLQLPAVEQHSPLMLSTPGVPLSPLTTCATVSTSVGHAITVEGEIYIAREDGKGSDGINTYEMVHLRPLPNTDPSQPTSYIIEPVQCSVAEPAPSYILHQTSPDQGAKLAKTPSSSGTVRQVVETHVDGVSQQSNAGGSNVITQPVIVSTLQPANGDTVVLTTESLPKHIPENTTEIISRDEGVPVEVAESYVEKGATDILQQDQQLECVSEEEISTTLHEETETSKELQNLNSAAHDDNRCHEPSHNALVYDHDSPVEPTSSTVTQSLDMNFSTTDNAIYSHSLVPSLVSNTRPARIIAREVIIAQPTLPEHILQTQGDEPEFLTDSTIVSSPLEIVDGALGEVTVATRVSGTSSGNLMMDNEMTYFK